MKLSPTKMKIFELLARGFSDKQIAFKLQKSPRTVQTHINNVVARMNAQNRMHAVAIFVQMHPYIKLK